jgi:ubiquinone/menaquinone biosynthesis C-methylase UbiE
MSLITQRLEGTTGGRILDVATEAGNFLEKTTNALSSFDEAIGIDIDDKELDKAREEYPDKPFTFIKMDAGNLSFTDGEFDMVAISAGLHHMTDIDSALREMVRVLRPGGRFILREMFCDNQTEKQRASIAAHLWWAKTDMLRGRPHFPTLKKQEIIDLVAGLGLSSYEMGEELCDCDWAADGKIEKEIASIRDKLTKLVDHSDYESLKEEAESLIQRLVETGATCATNLEVFGTK